MLQSHQRGIPPWSHRGKDQSPTFLQPPKPLCGSWLSGDIERFLKSPNGCHSLVVIDFGRLEVFAAASKTFADQTGGRFCWSLIGHLIIVDRSRAGCRLVSDGQRH